MARVYRLLLVAERPERIVSVWSQLQPLLNAEAAVSKIRVLAELSAAGRRGLHPGRHGLEIEALLELPPSSLSSPVDQGRVLEEVRYLSGFLRRAEEQSGRDLSGCSVWLEVAPARARLLEVDRATVAPPG